MQPEPAVLLAVLALPFLGAALIPLVYRVLGERTAYFAAGVAAVCLALLFTQYGMEGRVVVEWIPQLNANLVLYLDGLAFLIALLASGVGVLIFTYSGGYMHGEPWQAKYYTSLLVFMGAMLGVALAADLIALFVFWELTSVASFVLIGHYQRSESSRYAARKSMLITVSGGLFMLVGFLLLRFVAADAIGQATFALVGSPDSMIANAEAMRAALEESGLYLPVLALVGIGAAAKSAQVPLHIWLPDAMEAPTPVSAFLHSATMVKAGVYLVGRFRPLLITDEWMLAFAVLGLVTMTVAAILAVGATDIKELLAYSTASHLGLIVAGFGIANVYGGETGVLHILNHAVFKASLFLVAGIVAHEAGTRAIAELGGLREDLPITAGITAIAALGMAGLPPFNGFYSKELLFEATYEVGLEHGGLWWLLPVVAVFGSVFTFLYSIRFLMLFFGEKPSGLGEVHRPPWAMLAPPLLLAGIASYQALSYTGILPQVFLSGIADPALASVSAGEEAHHFDIHFPTKLSPYVLMSVVTIALGAVAYPFYDRLHHGVRRVRSVDLLSPNAYYDGGIAALVSVSDYVPRYVQTRLLRTYASTVMLGVCALGLGGYAAAGADIPAIGQLAQSVAAFVAGPAGLAIAIVLGVALVGAVAVSVAPSHIAGVLTLSILGFMVAVFYVLASAPDLALTQLVIETLVLVIFLLVLDKLPAFYGDLDVREAIPDALVAAVVGITVTFTVLTTTTDRPDTIARFFVERAPVPDEHGHVLLDYGGGGNVVNVILVDFRALDTMGEISVVAMAALAVLTLVGMRNRGENA
ncbi:hydrogen gas-evolving membrane-bound hydrogenase subunit E [Halomarina litorea]|uniref:hydrogen gas-evolving membrane-bound hydrogenase subunit E n=1 Tax=Halomarina litorea TaxID=2961595 RepID=UPI0020C46572|nr:hydrogen gas-evolving membrane-bound hydrogenase subunit E [Halomarina sp. BCD28]